MTKYLLKTVDTYRVASVSDVEQLHEELLNDPTFILTAFSYKTKYIKAKGEVVEEFQIVTVTKVFNLDEKEPERIVNISYEEM